MRNQLLVIIAALCLAVIPPQAHAAKANKAGKAAQLSKERLVLMPLRVSAENQNMLGAMETALVQGLQQKYEVFAGQEVKQKADAIFHKESAKKDCDETRCMEDIAIAFQSDLIATANVTKIEGGYLLALSIRNVVDNKAVYSNSLPCEGCTPFQVVDKLKELSGAPAQVATAPAEPEAPKVTATDPDSITWAEAQKGNTAEDYQVYLDTYPKGKYIPFARAKIKKLKEAALAATEQQEQQAWDIAQQENSEASYSLYLNSYPSGRFAGFAKARSDKLKNDVNAREEAELWNKADSGTDKAAVEAYLNRYPSGRYIVAATAKLKDIEEESKVSEKIAENMIRIPGKEYEMGKYEVTQKEWRAVMGNNPSKFTSCGDNCPVENVSWDDIQIYLQKLNAKSGRQYRLPVEAEWEYACCGGNDIDSVAWYESNSGKTTHPVGKKQANGYGLYDMSGNVWEWMENWYDSEQKERARRSGSWYYPPQYVRAAIRGSGEPSNRSYYLGGFRLARTLP